MPVVGFLNSASPDVFPDRLRAFHQGLKDTGFVEGENIAIAYRWAENQFDRLPELAAELVRLKVKVIAVNLVCRLLLEKKNENRSPRWCTPPAAAGRSAAGRRRAGGRARRGTARRT